MESALIFACLKNFLRTVIDFNILPLRPEGSNPACPKGSITRAFSGVLPDNHFFNLVAGFYDVESRSDVSGFGA